MAQYTYECSCGLKTMKVMNMSDMKKRVKCKCGKMAKRIIEMPNVIVHHRFGDPRIGRGKG